MVEWKMVKPSRGLARFLRLSLFFFLIWEKISQSPCKSWIHPIGKDDLKCLICLLASTNTMILCLVLHCFILKMFYLFEKRLHVAHSDLQLILKQKETVNFLSFYFDLSTRACHHTLVHFYKKKKSQFEHIKEGKFIVSKTIKILTKLSKIKNFRADIVIIERN